MSGAQHHNERTAKQLEEADRRQLQRHGKVPRPTAENFRNVMNRRGSGETGSSVVDLIQFLKKTPPPPTNYMSIPDDVNDIPRHGNKWRKFKFKLFSHHHRRGKKLQKPRPSVIKLPDSAVAATTTGGHRYIAISIPSEYSQLAPIPSSVYPVDDATESALQQEVGSRFGTPRRNTGVDYFHGRETPVVDDGEPSSYGSLRRSTSRPDHGTPLTDPTRRARHPSISLLRNEEQQRYVLHGLTDPARPTSQQLSEHPARPYSKEEYHDIASPSNEMYAYGPSGRDHHVKIHEPLSNQTSRRSIVSSKMETKSLANEDKSIPALSKKDVISSSADQFPENPVIILTVPSRTSSKRDKTQQLAPTPPPDMVDDGTSIEDFPEYAIDDDDEDNDDSSHESTGGHLAHGSFADSILSTSSSPKLLKAQTAKAFHSLPLVVRTPDDHDIGRESSPLGLDAFGHQHGHYASETIDHSVQTEPEMLQTLPTWPRGRKEGIREKLRTKIEYEEPQEEADIAESIEAGKAMVVGDTSSEATHFGESMERDYLSTSTPTSMQWITRRKKRGKGKEKETNLQPYAFMPGMPHSSPPETQPISTQDHQHRPKETSPRPPSSVFTSISVKSSEPIHSSSSSSQQPQRQPQSEEEEEEEERNTRYIAKALAEEKETLEKLPREDLIRRYKALQEQRIYEREKRLRKLERSRDTWVNAVPVLLENLNRLLREQHRILEGARLSYVFPTPHAGSSRSVSHGHYGRHGRHRQHRRSHSVEGSSSSSPALEHFESRTRRSRSLGSGSEPREGRRSSELYRVHHRNSRRASRRSFVFEGMG